jgi:rhodanese-related sulfurtransferase
MTKSIVSCFSGADCADFKVNDGDEISFGKQRLTVHTTPGHTNGCMSLHSPKHKMVFTGDTLMIRGCGRTDFQEGSAKKLFESVHSKIFTLPDETLVFPAHDYHGRTVSTISEEKKYNPRLGGGKSKEDFCRIMSDLNLSYPKKIDEAVPANLKCGILNSEEQRDRSPPMSPAASDSWAPVHRRQDIPEVNTEWVRENMETLRLIDIRDVAEFHSLPPLPASELIPMSTLIHNLKDSPKDERIIIICRSGVRSAKMAISLEQQGFICVASMKGGMQDWVVSSVGNCGK